MIVNQLPKKVYSTGREVIDWKQIDRGFTIEVNGQKFIVVSNENVGKVSKSGNAYKTRRLIIADVNGNEMEIGTESFKKGSFIKRFNKQFPIVKEVPTERKTVVINLGELEQEQEDTFDYESHRMTDSEQTELTNELYKILTERGLLQAYTDWENGKIVDKTTMERIMRAIDDSIQDDFDLDEIEKMLQESA
jgi:hypothetical protein